MKIRDTFPISMVIPFPIEMPRRLLSTKPLKFNSATFSRFVCLPKIDFLDCNLDPYREFSLTYPSAQRFCIQNSNQLRFSRSRNGISYEVLSKQKYMEVLKFPLKLLNHGKLKHLRAFVFNMNVVYGRQRKINISLNISITSVDENGKDSSLQLQLG